MNDGAMQNGLGDMFPSVIGGDLTINRYVARGDTIQQSTNSKADAEGETVNAKLVGWLSRGLIQNSEATKSWRPEDDSTINTEMERERVNSNTN